MPPQVKKSSVLAKHAKTVNAAIAKHADDPTDYGRLTIPPGINAGVARVTNVKFDEYKSGNNQGQPYFQVTGVCVEPKSVVVDGQDRPAAGISFNFRIDLFDRRWGEGVKTAEEAFGEVQNEFRKFGLSTSGMSDYTEMEDLADVLNQERPYYRFSTQPRKDRDTGKPDYNAEPWVRVHGSKGLEDYQPETGGGVTEHAEEAPARPAPRQAAAPAKPTANGKPAAAPANPRGGGNDRAQPRKAPEPEPEPEPVEEAQYSDQEDIDELVRRADDGDEDAQTRLDDMAKEAGKEKESKKLTTWKAVGDLLKGVMGAGEAADEPEPEEAPAEEFVPAKGDVYNYKPKGARKASEHKVTAVGKTTCSLQSLEDAKKTYKDVPFDQLESAS